MTRMKLFVLSLGMGIVTAGLLFALVAWMTADPTYIVMTP